ncbi:hypothetical protein ACS229_30880, partial [Klebsiella pneumoniae]
DVSSPSNSTPYARIDSTRIDVEDAPGSSNHYSTGLGVRLQMGAMDIVNGSHITAANVGAMLWGTGNGTGEIRLNVDGST